VLEELVGELIAVYNDNHFHIGMLVGYYGRGRGPIYCPPYFSCDRCILTRTRLATFEYWIKDIYLKYPDRRDCVFTT
jgi:hypothetical protein